MNLMPIKDKIIADDIEALQAARYHMKKLNEALYKQADFSNDQQAFQEKYRVYGPNKSDVISACDAMRKILLEIKKHYL